MYRATSGMLARRLGRRWKACLVTASLVVGLLPLAAPPAFAARAATASVDRKVGYRGQSYTYTFTLTNSSTAGESIGSVRIQRPSTNFTVSSCPQPPSGWSGSVGGSGSNCTYNSASGTGDNIPTGADQTFKVAASVATGKSSVEGAVWGVLVDGTDTFNATDGAPAASAAPAGGLNAGVYGIEVTDVVVGTAAATIGTACPAANKKGPAGSTRVLTICGRVHASSAFNAKGQSSDASGTFITNKGVFQGASVAPTNSMVVLGNYPSADLTATVANGLDLTVYLGNAPDQMFSPPTAFTGFSTDTVAPLAPSTLALDPASDTGVSSSDNITNDNTPTFTGSAEADSTVEILVGAVVRTTTTATGAGDFTATIPAGGALADGNRSVTARATDASGNVGPTSSPLAIVIDTTAPSAPSIGAKPGTSGSGTSPTWGFAGEASATFSCTLTYPDLTVTSDATCASPKTFDVGAGDDGTYTFRVSQTDVAGNGSPNNSDTYNLDREEPIAPNITARPADVVATNSVGWSFEGESGGSFECVLVKPDLSELTDSSCTSPKSHNLSAHPDGDYTFKVRQTDAVGHQGPFASDDFTLDRQAPSAPTITAQPDARSNDANPEWDFDGEPGGTFECVLVKPGNVQITTSECPAPKTYDLTGETDGTYTFKVRQLDDAANAGAFATSSFVLDRQAPAAPAITTRPSNFTNAGSPTWAFSGEDGAIFECILVRPNNTEMSDASCSSPKSFDLTTEDDGNYTFKVRQVDEAGNQSPYETDDFTLDRESPNAPSIDARPADVVAAANVQWSFSGEPSARFECVLIAPDLSETSDLSCGSPKSIDLGAGVDGLYTFKVRQFDRAGNGSAYSSDSFQLDREPPGTPSITGQPDARSNDSLPGWDFTGELGTTFECVLVKPGNVQITTSDCSAPQGYDLTGESDGSYTFKVRQFDAVGNPSEFTTSTFVLDRVAPAAPVFSATPRNYDDNPAPLWMFSGEEAGSFECVLVRPDNSEIGQIPCTSPASFDLTSEGDGDYGFKVRQIDVAGNPGPYATDEFTFDRTPPRPGLTGGAPEVTNASVHVWTFTGIPEPVFECTLIHPDNSETVVPNCPTPYELDLSDAPDGTYTLSVRQFLDENGSVPATDTFTVDRQVSAPSLSVQPGPISNDPSPEWSFGGEAGATFECVLVGPDDQETVQNGCTSPQQNTLDGDGSYTMKVRQTDVAGNVSAYATKTYVLDREAPSIPTFTSTPKNRSRDLTPTWSFAGEDGATYNCTLSSADGSTTTKKNCSSPKAYVLPKVQGKYIFSVTQVDTAGNESPAASHKTVLDAKKPVAKRLRVGPKRFRPTRRSVVKIVFGRSEAASATVTIKKGRKTIKIFKKKIARTKVRLRWRTIYKKKVIKPGKYTVVVALRDRVGFRSKVKKTVRAKR